MPHSIRRNTYEIAALCLLLIVLSLQLFFSVRRESQTWDEANHIFTGYRSWTHADFGLNPEHPPLVKLLATAPLLWLPLKSPALEGRFFKEDAFLGGKEFFYLIVAMTVGMNIGVRHIGDLCLFICSDRRRDVGFDPEESKVDVRYWSVAVGPRGFIRARVSKLRRVRK